MIIFKLPDLGEGLPDAIIREWYVKPGDHVKADQPLISMETAKALVDVPSPFSGKIEKLFGQVNDTIETGQPLVGFAGEEHTGNPDAMGNHKEENRSSSPSSRAIGPADAQNQNTPKATPAVRALAKKLGVNLANISIEGDHITAAHVEQAAAHQKKTGAKAPLEPLSPVRRAMAMSMTHSHQRVVPITLVDDADISAWDDHQDITVRLLRALAAACEATPLLNATFDDEQMGYHLNAEINVGIAVDTPHGLYVPVLKDIARQKDADLRKKIEQFKQQAQQKSIAQEDLHGATILLSNFGALAGRYATPIIVPPMVAIVGVGKARDAVIPIEGKPAVRRIMPLSVTVDHRMITGGEAAKFLKTLMDSLAKK